MLLHPRLVDLHHVGAGGEQILDLGIDRVGISQGDGFFVLVVIVLRLLAHGERARHRRLDGAVGIGAQHFEVAQLRPDRVRRIGADHARHRDRPAAAIDHRAGLSVSMPSSAVAKRLE
jgi:hypothetical protein